MHRREPPPQATWMLEHLTTGACDEALAGDLLEESRAGRSHIWYWRQVLSAILLNWGQALWRRRMVLLFAAMWGLLTPAWQLLWTRGFFEGDLVGHLWRLLWPWSWICVALVSIVESLLLVWLGATLYVTVDPFGLKWVRVRQLLKGICWSTALYLLTWVGELASAVHRTPKVTVRVLDWRALTLFGVSVDFTFWPVVSRIETLVLVACALWFLSAECASRGTSPQTPTEASSI